MGVDGRPAAVRRRYAEHRKRCVVNRRRCYVIAGVGIAGILVTAGAMAFAGCAYDRIQLAVTVEAMAVAAMFTPAYANSIA
ncbi:hypothetical protein F5Y04DRAFT_247727 [Hypomontagnella monticulosa]|nr:hypothetical protein F5Y04DRAFT_247727 [Hypomontagnella monticulosa]